MNDYSDLTVIIPTLNEASNIPKLLNSLLIRYKGISIIVSDDGSTDGTKDIVLLQEKQNKRIRFLDRKNKKIKGLTASVLDAANIVNTKKLVVMDGDLQHPVEKIAELSKELDKNELVIGVRTEVKNWSLYRRIESAAASSFVYTVFVLRSKPICKDMMSGFFGIRTKLFKSIINSNKDEFIYNGYKVLLDTLRIIGNKTTISEVPYKTFQNRKYGKSKTTLGVSQLANTLRSTLR